MPIWPLHDVSGTSTASIAAGVGVLALVGVRPLRQVLGTAVVFGALLLIADLLDGNVRADSLSATFAMLSQAVLPAVIGCFIVRSFRRMVTLELDRVLVQSTVSAPRYAVGMLASEELARLDLAAEQLLEGVSSGRTPLPLDAKVAQTAASLATELRLHLIEGRRETWLYHAVSESELLGPAVTLSDPHSLAGLLDPRQRDGLLSAIWLLVSESGVKVVGADRHRPRDPRPERPRSEQRSRAQAHRADRDRNIGRGAQPCGSGRVGCYPQGREARRLGGGRKSSPRDRMHRR